MAPKKQTKKNAVQEAVVENNENTKKEEPEEVYETPKTTKKWESHKDEIEVDVKVVEKKTEMTESESEFDSEMEKKERVVYEKKQIKSSKHQSNSVINFPYNDYRNTLEDTQTADLLKLLIVRAYDQNQSKLCETLKQTLRALHYECDFPICDNSNPKKSSEYHHYQQPYRPKSFQHQEEMKFGNRQYTKY
ncbi:hypothetical protein BMW23_0266 [Bodo saltans virus]|uniref:Uncharacterized protein n=1 Tax=Bodo saltans virus TaxID=2024608 RepID=A0A2H4UTX7_9VIRU|nr:hypothetical protein QJ851_gp0261 [Bodo saltans virus]ATZ80324.1 hypothetical protein BMW23_0266 [Bodo saltans virus]